MVEREGNSLAGVARVVGAVLRQQFPDLQLVSVEVEEGHDAGGDPVLDVAVVYEPDGRELDVSKVVAFVRHLRPELSDIGEDRFPMVSYIPADEYADSA
ncbi:MAG: hypothetical protein OXI22_02935 [Defluviicoccus sp.]|nr:hypothetical protein [Defluviicoccus sp.]MDE0382815.1 hypothetical protein [Defluviicoccus sp.]